jgi:hypothetical protein
VTALLTYPTKQKAALAAFCLALLLGGVVTVFAQEASDPVVDAPVVDAETATRTVPVVPATPPGVPAAADVYRVTQLDGDQNFGDFVVGPGKFDLSLAPGSAQTVEILVTNRSGVEKVFTLTTEDMAGSSNLEQPTVLLGENEGPYTLRDYLNVAAERFTIEPGQRVTVPITVDIPADAEPGGRYGSLLVQTESVGAATAGQPSAAVVSRIAVLFFVTTPGELNREGSLIDFTTVPDMSFFTSGPITFGLLYENTGTVHTNPAGEILITNMFGQEVGYLEVLPWFSLPQSLRLREVEWARESLLGRYTATTNVYRGYEDENGEPIIDTRSVSFWVVDWVILAVTAAVFFTLFILFRFVSKRFTLVRKGG